MGQLVPARSHGGTNEMDFTIRGVVQREYEYFIEDQLGVREAGQSDTAARVIRTRSIETK